MSLTLSLTDKNTDKVCDKLSRKGKPTKWEVISTQLSRARSELEEATETDYEFGTMKMTELRKLYDAEPFQPFLLHMANGRKIPVRHREFMALSPSGRTAYVYQMNDDSEVVDVALVTSLELRRNLANGKRDK